MANEFRVKNGLIVTNGDITHSDGNFTYTSSSELLEVSHLKTQVIIEVQNDTASTITTGEAVYVSGEGTHPSVTPARSDSASTMPSLGIVTNNIAASGSGYVTTNGVLTISNTVIDDTLSDPGDVGKTLYVSPTTAGNLTIAKPTTSSHLIQNVGRIVDINGSNVKIAVSNIGRVNDVPNTISITGSITGSSIIKSGGTSSQFLKADGSVDSSSYSTTTGTVTSIDVSGGTTGLTFSGGAITSSGTITMAGTLDVDNGGTGQTSYTNGQLLIGNSTGNTLSKANLSAGSGIDVTNGAGSIIISAETASATNPGIVELATTAETTTGTDATRAVTPDGLKDGYQGSTNVTTLGTIATGTWNGSVIASAYLDSDTAHLSGTQTFTGAKTFSASTLTIAQDLVHSGDTDNKFTFGTDTQTFTTGGFSRVDISDSGFRLGGSGARVTTINTGFVDNDTSLMTSQAIKEKIESYGYTTVTGDITGVDLTGGASITISGETGTESGNYSATIDVTDNTIGAAELNVSGNGTTTQFLRSDGDGTFSWAVPSGSGASQLGELSDAVTGPTGDQAQRNLGLGENALNSIVEYVSGIVTDGGIYNVAVGYDAGTAVTTGDFNTFVGYQAGAATTTGHSNVAIGLQALDGPDTEDYNIAIGRAALGGAIAGGERNIAIGYTALDSLTISDNNVAIGHNAGTAITGGTGTNGSNNTLVGYQSGNVITTGEDNVIIGADADPSANTGTNQIVIGKGATGLADNSVVLGNTDITAWLPPDDNGVDLGSSSYQFKDGYFHGNLEADAITLNGTALGSLYSPIAGSASITTVGTVTTGTWSASTIAVNKGGTGQTSYTNGQLLIGNSTGNTLSKANLSAGSGIDVTNGAGSIIISAETASATNPGIVELATTAETTTGTDATRAVTPDGLKDGYQGSTNVTTLGTISTGTWSGSTIAVDKGGTGQTSYTNGQLLIGNTTGNTLAKSTLTAGSGISITNGAGSITIAATGGGGASAIGDLSDVLMDATNFTNGFLLQTNSNGSAPTTGTLSSANYNIGIGSNVFYFLTSGDDNIALGNSALLRVTTGSDNIAVGEFAGQDITTGSNNILLGQRAGENLNGESGIVAIGGLALQDADPGSGTLTAIGYKAATNVTTAQQLLFVGYEAGSSVTTGSFNTLLGTYAGRKITTGYSNTGIGLYAAGGQSAANMTGGNNVAIGAEALPDLTSGSSNISVGKNSSRQLTTGSYNVAVGHAALESPTAVDYSIAIGPDTLVSSSLTGAGNIAIGRSSGNDITTGTYNVIMGYEAGDVITQGAKNITIGYQSGDNITTGSNNVVIGNADVPSATGDSQLSISNGDGTVTWIQGDSDAKVQIGDTTYNPSGITTGKLTVTRDETEGSDTGPTLMLVDGDSDANAGPSIKLYRNTDSPADNDTLGAISFVGEDSGGSERTYAGIRAIANDVTSGTTDAALVMKVMQAGTQTDMFRIDENGVKNMIAGVKAVSTNTTLTDDESGSYVYWTSGTLTLPATAIKGQQFTVINNTGGSATPSLGTSNSIATGWTAHAAMNDETARTYISVATNTWIYIG